MIKKYLKYTHPAAMKYDLKKLYELDELKEELDLDMIKVLFSPIDWDFEDLEENKKKLEIQKK